MSVLVISGTDTEVGKTVVVAALAALARERGSAVAVVKPAQTGVAAHESGDLAVVRSLAQLPSTDLFEFARFPDPLSPAAAARLAGVPSVNMGDVIAGVRALADQYRLVLVEGAGGLLVRYDDDGATLADLAHEVGAPVLVVARAGLGTLNATALTLEALAHRGLDLSGVVLGSWPVEPDLAARSNIRDLETLAARPLAGAMPEGAGRMAPTEFTAAARTGLGPAYGGTFDAADFRNRYDPTRKGNRE